MSAKFPPPGSTDCHTHVAGSAGRYPMVSPRAYTPMEASPQDMAAMMARTGTDRIVLVQMSVFGTDNTCMLDAMAELGPCTRGVVQVDEDLPGAELDAMHAQGVRGIRINLNTTGLNDPGLARRRIARTAEQCARNGWHIQLFTTPDVIATLEPELTDLPVPVVLDHFALLSPARRGGEAERVVRGLLASGRGWVKVSGTYRLDPAASAIQIKQLACDLHADNPDRIIWGSDWPHSPHHANAPADNPPQMPYRDIDPRDMIDTIRQWFDDDEARHGILVRNPARLYGF